MPEVANKSAENKSASFPATLDDFQKAAADFFHAVRDVKQRLSVPDYGWYPYDTSATLAIIGDLLAPFFSDVAEAVAQAPVADIGFGDGDLALLFRHLGCDVDAIEHAETNFNQLRGIELLQRELALDVPVHDIDLDRPFSLPRNDYGLALFLGTLYHLKNPFYVLENIAAHADWCVLSTRIAQITPHGMRIENESLAYLLGPREANNDPTNFWIFSLGGLRRLLERSGWMVMGLSRVGPPESDPVTVDERVYVLAKSRTRHPGIHVRLLDGWHAAENDAFRWTAKRFALEVTVPDRVQEFALRFSVPAAVCESGPLHLTCAIGGQPVGEITCDSPNTLEFRGRFPSEAITYRLDFAVESSFQPAGDSRELGICVPLLDASQRHLNRIPFRIS